MTQENKELLLRDICARLPYGVKCEVIKRDINGEMLFIRNGSTTLELTIDNAKELVTNNMYEIKPYLFPISSIGKDLIDELSNKLVKLEIKAINEEIEHSAVAAFEIEFCHKYHIDYRGLIPMGLAEDATGLGIYQS